MKHYDQQPAPAPVSAYPQGGSYVSAPPPMGYPTKDGSVGYPQQRVPEQTVSRGDGFLKGCFAALCCCCVLDCCF